MPALFLSHGSPMLALDTGSYRAALERFGRAHRPTAAVVVSGHWEAGPPVRITSAARQTLIYDFYGFPRELYELKYPAPGDPALANRLTGILNAGGIPATLDGARGLDHGAWAPLRMLYPAADIPIVQISLPANRTPESVCHLGSLLAPLAAEGILIIGTGGIVHNLRIPRSPSDDAAVEPWAAEFDTWIKRAVERRDLDCLLRYRQLAPHAAHAAPTTEHFDPVFVVLGSASKESAGVEHVYEGFQYGHMSLRCFSLPTT